MRLDFLCPAQRKALTDNPASARELWLYRLERLESLPAEPSPHRVSLAGSALEAAQLYLRAYPTGEAGLCERYVETALLLIDMLASLRQSQLAIVVIAVGDALLQDLSQGGVATAAAASQRLTRGAMERLGLGLKPSPPASIWDPCRSLAFA